MSEKSTSISMASDCSSSDVNITVQQQETNLGDISWLDSAFFRNTDWPALAINLVVLILAIFGVLEAISANAKAKETARKVFKEDQFKPLSDALLRPKEELSAASALAKGLGGEVVDEDRFSQEIDGLGSMFFNSLMVLSHKLRNIDEVESYGTGWENAFVEYRTEAEEAFDVAHDPQVPLQQRRHSALKLSIAVSDGLGALAEYEFQQRQTFGRRMIASARSVRRP